MKKRWEKINIDVVDLFRVYYTGKRINEAVCLDKEEIKQFRLLIDKGLIESLGGELKGLYRVSDYGHGVAAGWINGSQEWVDVTAHCFNGLTNLLGWMNRCNFPPHLKKQVLDRRTEILSLLNMAPQVAEKAKQLQEARANGSL